MSYSREDNEFKNRMALKAAAIRAAHEQDEKDEQDRLEAERLLITARALTQAVKAARKKHDVKPIKCTLLATVMGFIKGKGKR